MNILDLIMNNIYLYIFIIIGIVIAITILTIIIINSSKRKKIKNTYEQAEKVEEAIKGIEEEIENEKPTELESIIQKMQEDMEVSPEDVVKKFEEEQEEKAIISYQELVDNVKSGKIQVIDDDNSDINYVESLIDNAETTEPISSVETETEKTVTPEMVREAIETISNERVKDDVVTVSNKSTEQEPKKFKQSKIISPVFGYMDSNTEYSSTRKEHVLDIMNTRDYDKLTEEIKKQEEFLQALKEFRNNL